VVGDLEAAFVRDLRLALLDLRVVELLDATAFEAHEMVVVPSLVELEHRLAGFEVVACQESRLLELGQHAIHRGKADVEPFAQQLPVDVLGGQMPDFRRLEQVDDLETGDRGLEPRVLEVVRRSHDGAPKRFGGDGDPPARVAATRTAIIAGRRSDSQSCTSDLSRYRHSTG
jgi:hypothetical protein